MFPGFGLALIAFSGYVAWDHLSSPNSNTIQQLRKQSEEQHKQKDHLLAWVTGDKKDA